MFAHTLVHAEQFGLVLLVKFLYLFQIHLLILHLLVFVFIFLFIFIFLVLVFLFLFLLFLLLFFIFFIFMLAFQAFVLLPGNDFMRDTNIMQEELHECILCDFMAGFQQFNFLAGHFLVRHAILHIWPVLVFTNAFD